MPLPYDALRTFLAVAHAGSFTAAARELGVSQPWVSQRVAQLEAYLSRKRRAGPLQLLERRRRGVVLTPDGVMLRDLAADSLRKLEQLEDAFESRRGAFHGRVRLAASSTMLLYLVPEAVRRFRETYPNVRLETHHTNPVGDPILQLNAPLHADQLRERDWIVLRDFSLTRRILDTLLGSYPIAMEVEHWEVMKTYIALGVGVGLMPDLCILPQDRGKLDTIALGREFGRSSFCILIRKHHVLSPAVLAFIGLISPAVAQRLGK